MATRRPDLNIDLGELPNEPEELYSLAHRVNVACGGHAGDEASMHRACALAISSGTLVGAHPSYADREGFGRRVLAVPLEALRASLTAQCTALRAIAGEIAHLKPHGALYHEADRRPELAQLLVEVALSTLGRVAIVGPPDGELQRAAAAAALPFLAEGFADRRYLADGHLAPRTLPDALITDARVAAQQANRLARSGRFQTICVHSDTPEAVAIARAVRAALDAL